MAEFDNCRAKHGRARGFLDAWNPQAKTLALVAHVQAVLAEYREHLPLTARQIFYRLVAAHGFDKTNRDYKRLCEMLVSGRRAGVIPWDAIRDDGFTRASSDTYSDAGDFMKACRYTAEKHFRLDRQDGQRERLVVWCETSGMVPQLERVADRYGVPVFSSGGFDSVSVKHTIAREFAGYDVPVRVLHIGDHDPSGIHLFMSLAEDIGAFCKRYGGRVEFDRLAVLPGHIPQFGLVTAPPKPSDRRRFEGQTVQAESLPPDVLADLLRQGVESHFNMQVYLDVLDDEAAQRAALLEQFDDLDTDDE
ncbi:hypothetical protein [Paraburkholderia saeva]|uniref:Uncharacterized protein n=1 Tax=Paraburkholderia saeva TaxID=2777537 RepID=A0A9N8RZ14_9BURK|nr:hypothetical protein [Paraburkholderia saeva]CAG4905697.1 hypothetical protein LMG31841_03477 [Paraburkholderia saeva]